MTDERTVLDQIESHIWHVASQTQRAAETACDALGIDPDMPFEQFARRLRYGKKAEEMGHRTWTTWAIAVQHAKGWNSCLDAIKGDDR